MNQSIEKALEDSGLSGRDVTPFMRLSVVGLTTKIGQEKWHPRKGLITIWNPTEQQVILKCVQQCIFLPQFIPELSPFCLLISFFSCF